MSDIIVKQQPESNLTIQSSEDQVIIRQAADNVVVVQTTGSSYTLPAATANSLGGIIVGSNLSISNGVLSATSSGGVTAFNNRTGNVTLTANDVLGTGSQYTQPIYDTYFTANMPLGSATGGSEQIRGIKMETNSLGQINPFNFGFFGMGLASGNFFAGIVNKATNNITAMIQLRQSVGPFGGFEIVANQKAILVGTSGISITGDTYQGGRIYCQTSFQFGQTPARNEVLTKEAGDKLYQPLTRLN